jgi:hypothetical protein
VSALGCDKVTCLTGAETKGESLRARGGKESSCGDKRGQGQRATSHSASVTSVFTLALPPALSPGGVRLVSRDDRRGRGSTSPRVASGNGGAEPEAAVVRPLFEDRSEGRAALCLGMIGVVGAPRVHGWIPAMGMENPRSLWFGLHSRIDPNGGPTCAWGCSAWSGSTSSRVASGNGGAEPEAAVVRPSFEDRSQRRAALCLGMIGVVGAPRVHGWLPTMAMENPRSLWFGLRSRIDPNGGPTCAWG